MTSEEKRKTAQLLAACLSGYPNSKANNETIMWYVVALDDLSYPEIRAALTKLSRTAKFFPTVAEIYEAASSVRDTAQGNGKPDAGEAWEEAMKLVKTCHMYKAWTFSCQEVEQAVKQFGKMELIELKEDGMNTARAQFMRIYNGIINKTKDQEDNKKVLARMGANAVDLIAGAAKARELKLVQGGNNI